jgi:hypothetical protein
LMEHGCGLSGWADKMHYDGLPATS